MSQRRRRVLESSDSNEESGNESDREDFTRLTRLQRGTSSLASTEGSTVCQGDRQERSHAVAAVDSESDDEAVSRTSKRSRLKCRAVSSSSDEDQVFEEKNSSLTQQQRSKDGVGKDFASRRSGRIRNQGHATKSKVLAALANRRKNGAITQPRLEEAPVTAVYEIDSDDDEDWIVDDEDVADDNIVGCICGANTENSAYRGFWVQCGNELCHAWGHGACYGFRKEKDVPPDFRCHRCPGFCPNSFKQIRQTRYYGREIYAASSAGDHKALTKLARSDKIDTNWINEEEHTWTPLHVACANNNLECVKILRECGANPHTYDLENMTPIDLAIASNHHACVSEMLKYKAVKKDELLSSYIQMASSNESAQTLAILTSKTNDPMKCLRSTNHEGLTPLAIAAGAGSIECFELLLNQGADVHFKCHSTGATLVHLAARSGCTKILQICLMHLPPSSCNVVDTEEGWTPLFWAVERGMISTVCELIRAGAIVDAADKAGATPLHIAALGGHTDIVRMLLQNKHPVDIQDDAGWPPLLYADFTAKKDCVLSLFGPKPAQLMQLGQLLTRQYHIHDEMQAEKNYSAVKSAITSIATEDAYYSVLNDFLREHPNLLDTDLAFLLDQQGLVDFDNKLRWLQRKVPQHLWSATRLKVDREVPLHSITHALEHVQSQSLTTNFSVEFVGEVGMALGPKREFFKLLAADVCNPIHDLFSVCEGDGGLFPKCFKNENGFGSRSLNNADRLQHFFELGRLSGVAISQSINFGLKLSKPMVLQVLGRQIVHPGALEEVDPIFFKNLCWLIENDPTDIEITFSADVASYSSITSTEHMETVSICKKHSFDTQVTTQNASEYVRCMSQFKLCESVAQEICAYRHGLIEVIGIELLNPFSPAEFLLLLNGTDIIDVDEWKRETVYQGYLPTDNVILWFWKFVSQINEKEKAQLLMFSTGSCSVPAHGFSRLQGLGGSQRFTICKSSKSPESLPSASTCFNQLKIPLYGSAEALRQKILIAIRHGSEGFQFS